MKLRHTETTRHESPEGEKIVYMKEGSRTGSLSKKLKEKREAEGKTYNKKRRTPKGKIAKAFKRMG